MLSNGVYRNGVRLTVNTCTPLCNSLRYIWHLQPKQEVSAAVSFNIMYIASQISARCTLLKVFELCSEKINREVNRFYSQI